MTFDSDIDTVTIVKEMCDLMQICTQSGGLRPFGVSVLVAGIDNGAPKLFETDPTGVFFQYKATAIGEGEVEVEEILHKEYDSKLTIEEGLKLSVKALKRVLGQNYSIDRVEAVYIDTKNRAFTKFQRAKLEKLSNDIKIEKVDSKQAKKDKQ